MAIRKEVLQELLKDYKGPEDLLGEDGVLKELTRELVETALGAELTDHLGYDRHEKTEKPTENRRNGTSRKSVRSDLGPIEVDIPRDREGTFEPRLIAKHQREIPGFSDKILSMYARGMTNREIAGHLKELYGTEVSPQFITTVTDGVLEHLEAWRNRELESVYPIVFFDAIVLKIRENGHVAKRSMHLALAINLEGKKELLGLWMAETEGANDLFHEIRPRYSWKFPTSQGFCVVVGRHTIDAQKNRPTGRLLGSDGDRTRDLRLDRLPTETIRAYSLQSEHSWV